MSKPYDDYAVVCSGGGALGSWEVGCLEALLEFHDGQGPSIITGASAGALNAAGWHCGLSTNELATFWSQIQKDDIFEDALDYRRIATSIAGSQAANVLRGLIAREEKKPILDTITEEFSTIRSIFNTSPMEATLERILGPEERADAFAHPRNSLVISTTKLADGAPELLFHLRGGQKRIPKDAKRGRYVDSWTPIKSIQMLRQSLMGTAALPLLFSDMEGRFDGGVLLNQPIAPAIGLGARVVYVFIPSPITFGSTRNLAEIAGTLASTLLATSLQAQIRQIGLSNRIYSQTLSSPKLTDADRQKLEQRIIRLCVIRPPVELPAGLLSFGEDVEEMIERGRRDTRRRIKHFDFKNLEWWDAFMDDDGVML